MANDTTRDNLQDTPVSCAVSKTSNPVDMRSDILATCRTGIDLGGTDDDGIFLPALRAVALALALPETLAPALPALPTRGLGIFLGNRRRAAAPVLLLLDMDDKDDGKDDGGADGTFGAGKRPMAGNLTNRWPTTF